MAADARIASVMPATRTVRSKVPRATVTVADAPSSPDEDPDRAAQAIHAADAATTAATATTRTTPGFPMSSCPSARRRVQRAIIVGGKRASQTCGGNGRLYPHYAPERRPVYRGDRSTPGMD